MIHSSRTRNQFQWCVIPSLLVSAFCIRFYLFCAFWKIAFKEESDYWITTKFKYQSTCFACSICSLVHVCLWFAVSSGNVSIGTELFSIVYNQKTLQFAISPKSICSMAGGEYVHMWLHSTIWNNWGLFLKLF